MYPVVVEYSLTVTLPTYILSRLKVVFGERANLALLLLWYDKTAFAEPKISEKILFMAFYISETQ